jgi:hypothetical protein
MRSKKVFSQISRAAGIRLTLSAALILGASCLVLQSTVWHDNAPAEADRYYAELPGVDLSSLQPAEKEALLKRLNQQHCPCNCLRTIASCRNRHTSCTMSLAIARQAAEAAKKH